MAKPTNSATGKGKVSVVDNNRAAFRQIAERAEKNTAGTYANVLLAQTARAAEQLVGTDRARKLLNDGNFNRLYREMARAYGTVGTSALSKLDKALDNDVLNNPAGSGYSADEWQEVKGRIQGLTQYLYNNGYSENEIAAALAYGSKLSPARETSRTGGEKVLSLDSFLAQRGLSSPISDYTLDTTRLPHGETARQKKQREAESLRAAREYSQKRRDAINEYNRRVKAGEFRAPTKIEEMLRVARGNPDNASVQAARRALKKRGLTW